MKKLPVLLLAVVLWSCNQTKPKNEGMATDTDANNIAAKQSILPSAPALATSDQLSLNGIDKAIVENWAKAFEEKDLYQNKPPKKFSVFFSKEIITGIDSLFEKELRGTGDKPDGFRIYFLKNGSSTIPTLAIVSTKNNGYEAGRYKHVDYYKHDTSNVLFKLPSLQGIRCLDDCSKAARLYNDCVGRSDCNITCNRGGSTQAVSRPEAETMVRLDKKFTYNTKSVWFDIDLLHKLRTFPYSGIRIYLSNYGKLKPKNSEKLNRYTFLLTATRLKDGKQEDIYDCYPFKNLWKNLSDPGDGGINNGELCPNHCNDDDSKK
jgi:hypothetical protein